MKEIVSCHVEVQFKQEILKIEEYSTQGQSLLNMARTPALPPKDSGSLGLGKNLSLYFQQALQKILMSTLWEGLDTCNS